MRNTKITLTKAIPVELPVSKPTCDTCKKEITDAWADFERFRYRTIEGKIKETWCCIDCQLNNLYKEDEAC